MIASTTSITSRTDPPGPPCSGGSGSATPNTTCWARYEKRCMSFRLREPRVTRRGSGGCPGSVGCRGSADPGPARVDRDGRSRTGGVGGEPDGQHEDRVRPGGVRRGRGGAAGVFPPPAGGAPRAQPGAGLPSPPAPPGSQRSGLPARRLRSRSPAALGPGGHRRSFSGPSPGVLCRESPRRDGPQTARYVRGARSRVARRGTDPGTAVATSCPGPRQRCGHERPR